MGHGHGPPYVVPPYTCFNSIEGIVPLVELKKCLAARGLKDPWIRNEIWRYHPGFGTRSSRARALFCRGMPLGLILGAAGAVLDFMLTPHDHGHGHGHDADPKCDDKKGKKH